MRMIERVPTSLVPFIGEIDSGLILMVDALVAEGNVAIEMSSFPAPHS